MTSSNSPKCLHLCSHRGVVTPHLLLSQHSVMVSHACCLCPGNSKPLPSGSADACYRIDKKVSSFKTRHLAADIQEELQRLGLGPGLPTKDSQPTSRNPSTSLGVQPGQSYTPPACRSFRPPPAAPPPPPSLSPRPGLILHLPARIVGQRAA